MAMNSTRRKLAIGTWKAPAEGNIYGKLTVPAGPALAYLAALRERTGEKVTMTHFVGKAVALALRKAPGLNGRIRFGRFIEHPTVDIAFLVALDGGADLAKAKIERLDEKPVQQVAVEVRELAEKLRAGKDKEFESSKSTLKLLPRFAVPFVLWLTGWLTASLGLNLPALGLSRFPFGSAVVTSVGMFGLDEGFVPPTPFARVPLYVLVGAVKPRPAVVDQQVVVQDQMTITATLDHRFVDGFGGAQLAKVVRAVFEDPEAMLGPLPEALPAPAAEPAPTAG